MSHDKPRRSRARRIFRWVGFIALGLLGVIVLALGFIHTPPGRNLVRGKIEDVLNGKLAGKVSIGALDGWLLGSPTLHRLKIVDREGREVAYAEKVKARYSLLSIVFGDEIVVSSVELHEARVAAERQADGSWNVANLVPPEPEPKQPSTLRLRVDSIRLHDSRVAVTGIDPPTTLEHVGADVALRVDRGATGVVVRQLTGRWVEADRDLAVAAGVDTGPTGTRVGQTTIQIGASSVVIDKLVLGAEGQIDAALRADVNSKDLGPFAPAKPVHAVLTLGAERASAQVPIAINGQGEINGQTFAVTGQVVPEMPSARARLRIGKLDLSAVSPDLPPGTIAGTIEAAWSGKSLAEATASVQARLDADITGYPPGKLELDAKLAGGRLDATAKVDSPRAKLDLSGSAMVGHDPLRLDDVKLTASTPGVTVGDAFVGATAIEVAVDGAWPRLAASGRIRLASLNAPAAKLTRADAQFDLRGLPEAPAGNVVLRVAKVNLPSVDLGQVSVDVEATGLDAAKARVYVGSAITDYMLDTRFDFKRTASEIAVALHDTTLRTGRVNFKTEGADLRYATSGEINVTPLVFTADEAEVKVAGRLVPRGNGSAMTVSAEVKDFAKFRVAVKKWKLPTSGSGLVEAKIAGSIDRPRVVVAARARELKPRGDMPAITGTVDATVGNGDARLVAQLDGAGVHVAANIEADVPGRLTHGPAWRGFGPENLVSADIEATGADLKSFFDLAGAPRFHGKVTRLDAKLTRGKHGPNGEIGFSIQGFRPDRWPHPVNATLVLALADGRVLDARASVAGRDLGRIDMNAGLAAPANPYDVKAWQRLGQRAVRHVDVKMVNVEIAEVFGLLGLPPPAIGRIDGSLSAPEDGGAIELSLSAGNMCVPALLNCVRGEMTAKLDDRVLTTKGKVLSGRFGDLSWQVVVDTPAELLDAGAWASLDDRAVRSARVEIDDMKIERVARAFRNESPVVGTLDIVLAQEKTGAPMVLTVDGRDLRRRGGKRSLTAKLGVSVSETEARAQATATFGLVPLLTADVSMGSGRAALRRDPAGLLASAVRGELVVADFPLEALANTDESQGKFAGKLRANGKLTGTLAAPTFAANAAVIGGRLSDVKFEELAADVAYDGGSKKAEINARVRQSDGGELDLHWRGAPDSDLDLAFQAKKFDLGVVGVLAKNFTDWVLEADGKLFADLKLTGSRAKPELAGTAHLAKGRVRLREFVPLISQIDLKIKASSGKLTGELTGISSPGNQLHGTFDADLEGLRPSRAVLDLDARKLPIRAGQRVILIDNMHTKITAEHKDVEGWLVDVKVLAAEVKFPLDADKRFPLGDLEDITYVDGRRKKPAKEGEPLRIKVLADGTVNVETKGARTRLRVELDIKSNGGETSIDGDVVALGGHVMLFERPYQVLDAKVTFTGDPTNPLLDVRIVEDYGDVAVYIVVKGSAREPRIAFASDPPIYDQGQVLALVLGRSPAPSSGAGGSDPSFQQGASNVVSSAILDTFAGVVGEKILTPDVVQVEQGQSAQGGQATRVTVGKWIGQNLFLTYRYRSAAETNENSSEAAAEYRLSLNWIIEAVMGDKGAGGLDVLWIKRY